MNKYLFIFFVVAISAACHRQRQKSMPSTTTADTSKIAVIDSAAANAVGIDSAAVADEIKLQVAETHFEYLTAKSKVSFKSKTQDIDNANVSIRMKKDSIIWLSIVAGPIEVVRGLIRPDSIQIIDRYHKEYYQYTFAELSQRFNFNINFDLLQAVLVGNMPIPKKINQRFKKESDYFMLKQDEGKIVVENYIGEQNRRLKKLLVTEQPTKNTLNLDYEDFTELNNFLFPYTSLIQLDYESKEDKNRYQTVFRIRHQKVEIKDEPLTFPFSIPARFQKK